ncbi:hypothetical protein JUN65_02140 [Gluconacetobacter azotocaptans]|uniref:hypothetical protein n=1 Tax=Gluconacetobacter azotocaptans TaxID=142834 RepID=UPI00195718F8|nr:hypothetical protein [Gluconacetobacter azotocaptans]MBM9400394.1 hypothetical protein [Gluconacetobacter azotocaptans]
MSGFLLKRGATFLLAATVTDNSGALVDLTGCIFASQLRDAQDAELAVLTVQPAAGWTGVVQFSWTGDTSTWPVGRYRCDLRITWPDSRVQLTDTFSLTVAEAVTQ